MQFTIAAICIPQPTYQLLLQQAYPLKNAKRSSQEGSVAGQRHPRKTARAAHSQPHYHKSLT